MNLNMLTHITPCDEYSLSGIVPGASIVSISKGKCKPPFENVTGYYFGEDVSDNLLADTDVKEEWLITRVYNHNSDCYVLTSIYNENISVRFDCVSEQFVHDTRERRAAKCLVSNSYYQKLGVNKLAITKMMLVEKFHQSLSYVGLKHLHKMVENNVIENCPFSANDVSNYAKYMHSRSCTGCICGKRTADPQVSHSSKSYNKVGESLCIDLFYLTTSSKRDPPACGLLCVDTYSMFKSIHWLDSKSTSDINKGVDDIITMYSTHAHVIRTIRIDNETGGNHLQEHCSKKGGGIRIHNSLPHAHVALVESSIRYVKSLWRSTIHGLDEGLICPRKFYKAAFVDCVHSINCALTSHNDYITPHQLFYGTKPIYKMFQGIRWGDIVTCKKHDVEGKDEDSRVDYGIVLGRVKAHIDSGFYIYNLYTHKWIKRGDCVKVALTQHLREKIELLDYTVSTPDIQNPSLFVNNVEVKDEESGVNHAFESTINLFASLSVSEYEDEFFINPSDDSVVGLSGSGKYKLSVGGVPDELTGKDVTVPEDIVSKSADCASDQMDVIGDTEDYYQSCTTPADSGRNIVQTDHLTVAEVADDGVTQPCDKVLCHGNSKGITPLKKGDGLNMGLNDVSSRGRQRKPSHKVNALYTRATGMVPSWVFADLFKNGYEPAARAISAEIWRYKIKCLAAKAKDNLSSTKSISLFGVEATANAIHSELRQMETKVVWLYVTREEFKQLVAEGVNILPSSLFLKDKYFADGTFEKLKARLVVCGNYQSIEILDESDTESPTVSINTVLILISIAAKLKLIKHVYDVSGAFLNGDLDTPEYMKISKDVTKIIVESHPEYAEFVQTGGVLVVKLLKALYGLRQASKKWYDSLSSALISRGYVRSNIDSCLFVKNIDNDVTYVLVYVDDLLVMGSNEQRCLDVRQLLIDEYKDVTSKTGDDLSFIGMEISTDSNNNISLSQTGYIKKLLSEYDIVGVRKNPVNVSLTSDSTGELVDHIQYLTVLMKIMYLATRTRPDIIQACVVLASRTAPTVNDYKQLFCILEFLNGTQSDGITFRSEGMLSVNCYVDASFDCYSDAKGHSGFVIFPDVIGSSAIMVKSMKQKVVADSSAEAEIIALHECVKNLMYVASIYEELGYKQTGIPVQQDNQAVIKLSSKAPVTFKGRSKFINRKYFSVHQYVTSGEIELVYVGTDVNVADYLTKALAGGKFKRFRIDILGSKHDLVRGHVHPDEVYEDD